MLHGPQRGLFDLERSLPAECADRLADALGFGVLGEAQQGPTVEEALEHLPEAARTRLGTDYHQWKGEIRARLQAWA